MTVVPARGKNLVIEPSRIVGWMVDITLGRPAPTDLTAEERARWDKLAEEIAAIRARGLQVEIPIDILE